MGKTSPFRGSDGEVFRGNIAGVAYRRLGGANPWCTSSSPSGGTRRRDRTPLTTSRSRTPPSEARPVEGRDE